MINSKVFSKLYNVAKKYIYKAKDYENIYSNINDLPDLEGGVVNSINASIKVREETDRYIFSSGKAPLIDLKDPPMLDNSNRGQFFQRAIDKLTNSTILRKATKDEVLDSNNLAIGGIDFDTPRAISALVKMPEALVVKNGNFNSKDKIQSVAVFPEVIRAERYAAAEIFSEDPTYYPPYIKDRVNKYLIPKIVDDDNTILNVPISVSLSSFSVGGREIMMMENALKDILAKDYSVKDNTIAKLLYNFKVVCVGYAYNPSHIQKIGFPKIVVFSRDDRRVLQPEELARNVLAEYELIHNDKKQKFTVIDIGEKVAYPAYMFITSHEGIKLKSVEEDTYDHTINEYLEGVKMLPDDLQYVIGDFLHNDNLC